MSNKKTILTEAQEIVYGARQDDYGHPSINFKRIAELWSPILGTEISVEKVALCMIQLKVARHINSPKRDNLVDIAGYAATLDML